MLVAYQSVTGFLRVASNVRVAGGRKNALDQRPLGDDAIGRVALFDVNDKMRCAVHYLLGSLAICV